MIDIRSRTAKMLKENYRIDEKVTEMLFEKGILREDIMKKVLIREDYKQKVQHNGKQRLRNELAQSYCVSVKLVEKIVL